MHAYSTNARSAAHAEGVKRKLKTYDPEIGEDISRASAHAAVPLPMSFLVIVFVILEVCAELVALSVENLLRSISCL